MVLMNMIDEYDRWIWVDQAWKIKKDGGTEVVPKPVNRKRAGTKIKWSRKQMPIANYSIR